MDVSSGNECENVIAKNGVVLAIRYSETDDLDIGRREESLLRLASCVLSRINKE